ncbi:hypothetical protein [Streptomyces sp. IB2014 011-1]|nr:hypothetical protein [Streptomyces sp. IB2014 011-1]
MREHIEAAMKSRTKAEPRINRAGHNVPLVTKLHADGEFGGS